MEEVALTALEQSLRALFRINVIKKDSDFVLARMRIESPFAENEKYWIPIGLNEDLDIAMKNSVRQGDKFFVPKVWNSKADCFGLHVSSYYF